MSFILNKTSASFIRPTAIISRRQFETQETQETGSFDYSDASSINRFPAFQFSLHILTPLSSLRELQRRGPSLEQAYTSEKHGLATTKLNVLAAVLEVEGPDNIRVKKGFDAGKDVSLLKLIIADEDGAVCKLTAWREVAESWGGSLTTDDAVKRGDIALFESKLTARVTSQIADLYPV